MDQPNFCGNELKAILVDREKCELEGPYECPHCGGHFMVDATFLDQVESYVSCPCCISIMEIPEIPKKEKEENHVSKENNQF